MLTVVKHPTRRLLDRHPGATCWTDDVTVIGPQLTFKGEIRAPGIVVVAGHVDGPIVAGDLVHVLAGAVVKGAIRAESALVEGSVDGPMTISEEVEIRPAGRVRGDIVGARVAIGEGCFIKGRVKATAGPVIRFRNKRMV